MVTNVVKSTSTMTKIAILSTHICFQIHTKYFDLDLNHLLLLLLPLAVIGDPDCLNVWNPIYVLNCGKGAIVCIS